MGVTIRCITWKDILFPKSFQPKINFGHKQKTKQKQTTKIIENYGWIWNEKSNFTLDLIIAPHLPHLVLLLIFCTLAITFILTPPFFIISQWSFTHSFITKPYHIAKRFLYCRLYPTIKRIVFPTYQRC